jgi:class 3 adenylate cyclase
MESTTDNLRNWLTSHGIEGLAEVLIAEDVDLEIIANLKETDLKEIGLSLGNRKRLLQAIETLSVPADIEPDDISVTEFNKDNIASSHEEAGSAERRQVTVLFCDLVGSTELSTKLDPEDMRELLLTYQEACTRKIARYEGFVAKFMGDGVYAYFGYPTAHEDDAERAINSGLGIVKAIKDLNSKHCTLAVRIGVATGNVAVGDLIGEGASEEAAIVGEAPNLAARL